MQRMYEVAQENKAWRERKDLQGLFAMVASYNVRFGRTSGNDLLIDSGYDVQTLKEIKRQAAEMGFKARLNVYKEHGGESDSGYLIIYTRI